MHPNKGIFATSQPTLYVRRSWTVNQ